MARRNSVLHIVYSLDYGGTETQLRLIAETQGKQFRHSFCALAAGGCCFEKMKKSGAEMHLLDIDVWQRPAKAIHALHSLLGRVRPDVVHCHAADANLFGLVASWIARTPVRIGEEVGMPKHGAKAKLLYRAIYGLADHIIAVSDAVAQCIVDLGEAPRWKIERLHNPVELSIKQATPRQPKERLRIASVGRLERWKNPLALVMAATLLEDVDLEVILVGDGSQRSEIESAIAARNLGGRVRLVGFVSTPQEILTDCHLYVQPSPSEGFGIALVEAMGCSLPVIASAYGGAREFIEDGVNGWLLSEPNAEGIAGAIRQAAQLDPKSLAQIGKRARQAIEGRFAQVDYLGELEMLYERALLRKSAA